MAGASDTEDEKEEAKEQTQTGEDARPPADATPAPAPGRKRGLLSLLCRLLADVMLLGLILSTVLGVVLNAGHEVIQPTAKPVPFFPRTAHRVADYYKGNIFQAFANGGQYENAVFMYYAPWDRASQEARAEFLRVSEFFRQTDILVAAVNCWFPSSDCAKEFGNKSLATPFPVVIFYPGKLNGVQYRGVLEAERIIRWIQRCRYPLLPLHSASHLSALQASHPTVLVGYLPLTSPHALDPVHRPLLTTALQLLEVHPDGAIGVAVTTDPVIARSLRLGVSQPVRLFTWNSSLAFPNKTVDSDRLLVWAIRHDSQVAPWLRLPGRKSMVLQRSLGQHALLVFATYNALAPSSAESLSVRRVAASYRDCTSSPVVASYREALAGAREGGCGGEGGCGWEAARERGCLHTQHCTLHSWGESSSAPAACRAVPTNVSCEGGRGGGAGYDEEVELLLLEEKAERAQCPAPQAVREEGGGGGVEGLGCGANKSLSIHLVDNQLHSSLLFSLGLPLHYQGGVILSSGEEQLYTMQEQGVSEGGLEGLVLAWHSGQAEGGPGLRTTGRQGNIRLGVDSPSPPSSHDHAPSSSHDPAPSCATSLPGSCLPELNSQTLESVVLNNSSPGAVVFYTSPFCSHCTAVSHVVHTVQRVLAPLDNLGLRFYTVDGTRNDLPIQLTALTYPTVLVFPENRKTESRVFPSQKELNTTNLLTFIVSNLSPSNRLKLALHSCDPACLARLRLSASAALGRLTSIARRRPGVARRRGYLRRLKYNRTVLYVVTAWSSTPTHLPRVGENFVAAILESFREATSGR